MQVLHTGALRHGASRGMGVHDSHALFVSEALGVLVKALLHEGSHAVRAGAAPAAAPAAGWQRSLQDLLKGSLCPG